MKLLFFFLLSLVAFSCKGQIKHSSLSFQVDTVIVCIQGVPVQKVATQTTVTLSGNDIFLINNVNDSSVNIKLIEKLSYQIFEDKESTVTFDATIDGDSLLAVILYNAKKEIIGISFGTKELFYSFNAQQKQESQNL